MRVINRPSVGHKILKIAPPEGFSAHQDVAKENWDNDKLLIYRMTQFVRERLEEYSPKNLNRERTEAFEREFRGTESPLDGTPLIVKFWIIMNQIRTGLKLLKRIN